MRCSAFRPKMTVVIRKGRQPGRASFGAALAVVTALALVSASSAAAADFYVDDDTGSDANACTSQGAPCVTITGALNKANGSAGAGDTLWVDGGDYSEAVDLDNGTSLRELDFNTADDDTQADIYYNASPSSPVIRVLPGKTAGVIDGFNLGSNGNYTVALSGTATMTDNTFDWVEDGSP